MSVQISCAICSSAVYLTLAAPKSIGVDIHEARYPGRNTAGSEIFCAAQTFVLNARHVVTTGQSDALIGNLPSIGLLFTEKNVINFNALSDSGILPEIRLLCTSLSHSNLQHFEQGAIPKVCR